MATKKGFQVLIEVLPALLDGASGAAGGARRRRRPPRTVPRGGPALGGPRPSSRAPVLRDTLPDLYRAADLFVLPAVHDAKGNVDGLPNVILEAMASGLPVVASGISGIPLAVEDGRTGRWCRSAIPAALLGALRAAARGPRRGAVDGGAGAAQGRGGADLGRGRGALPGGVPDGAGTSLARAGLISYTSGTSSASAGCETKPLSRAHGHQENSPSRRHQGRPRRRGLRPPRRSDQGRGGGDRRHHLPDREDLAGRRPAGADQELRHLRGHRPAGPDGGQPGERRADVHPSAQGVELQAGAAPARRHAPRHPSQQAPQKPE